MPTSRGWANGHTSSTPTTPPSGRLSQNFPADSRSNRSLQGTPEFAYGITNWWEGGFYLPFAVASNGELLSDGAKIRSLFVVPDAAKRNFFYGVNFELGYETRSGILVKNVRVG